MASTMPAELVEEILLRVPSDEPANLVHAAVVCRAWRRILSDHGFLRRYRRFHGTPPILGYICNGSAVRFVPTTSVPASPISIPELDCSRRWTPSLSALDCRHGRVLIQAKDYWGYVDRLIVWDPITGSQQQLMSVPSGLCSRYAGAVLCAKDGGCDHHDCHGASFLVVLVGTIYGHDNGEVHTWARVYSSETGVWSAGTPNGIPNHHIEDMRPGLLIGGALYFRNVFGGYNIIKYDLCKHELSVMTDLPIEGYPILIKGDDGGLGIAAILHNCIYIWSWKLGIKGVGEWVKYRVVELDDTLLPKGVQPQYLICMAEGTNTVFIGSDHAGILMLDLKSKQVRKIEESNTYFYGFILPYTSFYTPKY